MREYAAVGTRLWRPLSDHFRLALRPEPGRALWSIGIAALVYIVVVFFAVRTALLWAGYPAEGLFHAVLPAVFAGGFGFLGSLGGTLKTGLVRAVALPALGLPLTLVAIVVSGNPIAAAVALAAAALGFGAMAWYGEPLATFGSLLLYMYFVPFAFGAGDGVPWSYLLLSFAVMIVCTVVLRAVVAVVPKRDAPTRAKATDDPAPRPGRVHRFELLPEPQLSELHRTAVRSAIGLGLGAAAFAWTKDHNAVWVLMTLMALIPPTRPLTIERVLQRLVGTALAMVFLTVVDALIPAGPLRLLVLAPAIVLTVTFVRRSYPLSVLGVSMVAVLAYAGVTTPLSEALLWRGLDTLVGAVVAIVVVLLIPVARRTGREQRAVNSDAS